MANQASMVRRQRERARQQKRREKHARKMERRELKKETETPVVTADPYEDPTIDWGAAVHETEVVLNEDLEVVEEPEEEEEKAAEAQETAP